MPPFKFKWALINKESEPDNSSFSETWRMRVPHGHLYRFECNTAISIDARQVAVAMVFVPTDSNV